MNHSARVSLGQGLANSLEDAGDPVCRSPGQGDIRRLALDEFHNKEWRAMIEPMLEDSRHPGQGKFLSAFHFLRKALAGRGILANRRMQHFDRHFLSSFFLLRAIDHTKSSFADARYGLVARQLEPRNQSRMACVRAWQTRGFRFPEADIGDFA